MENVLGAVRAAAQYADAALEALHSRLEASSLDAQQHPAHGYAWIATAAASLEALAGWHERLEAPSEIEDRKSVVEGKSV